MERPERAPITELIHDAVLTSAAMFIVESYGGTIFSNVVPAVPMAVRDRIGAPVHHAVLWQATTILHQGAELR